MTQYEGRHRPASPTWAPDYGPAVPVRAGFGLSLGVDPHMTLQDETGAQVRIALDLEDVEHIVSEARAYTERMESRAAEQERQVMASLEREDRHFRTHLRIEATS